MNSHKTNYKGDSEGFGITFLESNACGKPIIGTNSGGIPDAIDHRENGLLIEANQPSKTADAILELFNDKEGDYWKIAKRFNYTEEVLKDKVSVVNIFSKEKETIKSLMELVLLGDLVSLV